MSDRNNKNVERLFRCDPARPLALLKKCPIYEATPLTSHRTLADELGVASVMIKDESSRMRLGSFKALGGVFAIAQILCDLSSSADPLSEEAKQHADGITFVTASAGNHGMSVAAGARLFGAKAQIILPRSAPESFATRIASFGAKVERNGTYEECVAEAIRTAEKHSWIHIADGSWPGYLDAPALIMEGYTVLAEECRIEFESSGEWPTHVFLQAGVGGMAAAVAGHIRSYWADQPTITIVEPDKAPCLKVSVEEGTLKRVEGKESEMGRLDCKDASLIAFESLRKDADHFILISDLDAKLCKNKLKDLGLASTESGVAGIAGANNTKLDPKERVLVILSEGELI